MHYKELYENMMEFFVSQVQTFDLSARGTGSCIIPFKRVINAAINVHILLINHCDVSTIGFNYLLLLSILLFADDTAQKFLTPNIMNRLFQGSIRI